MVLRDVILTLIDEEGHKELERRLRDFPEHSSEEAAGLIKDFGRRAIREIKDYCDQRGISCIKDIEGGGIVYARMSEEQVDAANSECVIEIGYRDFLI